MRTAQDADTPPRISEAYNGFMGDFPHITVRQQQTRHSCSENSARGFAESATAAAVDIG